MTARLDMSRPAGPGRGPVYHANREMVLVHDPEGSYRPGAQFGHREVLQGVGTTECNAAFVAGTVFRRGSKHLRVEYPDDLVRVGCLVELDAKRAAA